MQSTWDLSERQVPATAGPANAHQPWVTRLLTVLLIGVMAFAVIAGGSAWRTMADVGGLRASTWTWNDPVDYLRLFSYQFVHGSASHFFWNSLFLLLTGFVVERRNGSAAMVTVLVSGGVIAGLSHLLFFPNETRVLIGASGAVAALMGMAFVSAGDLSMPVRIPRRPRVYFRISLRLTLGLWLGLQVVALLKSVVLAGDGTVSVAYWSHIAGFIAGGLAIFVLRSFTPVCPPAGSAPVEPSLSSGD